MCISATISVIVIKDSERMWVQSHKTLYIMTNSISENRQRLLDRVNRKSQARHRIRKSGKQPLSNTRKQT